MRLNQFMPGITVALTLGMALAVETKLDVSAKTTTATVAKMKKDSSAKAVVIPAKEEKPAKVEKPVPQKVAAPAKGCAVAKIAFGTAIENREVKGEAAEFPAGRVYCWSRLACGGSPLKVQHVWYKDGKKAQNISLASKSGNGRVWSNAPVSAGAWKVEVVNDSGATLGSGEFTVK